ncbi:HalOD1 output domain-containing protein [Haloarcula nitratireducens]|uniref:Halobacterial output domain-containing protein n=1 Tax=Haloarcula nitratireducens TaxID=2487749 RepID=A0AAW4PJA5_9EURY|nr:HalOD1 output domain-containing protein [Halomicroarcula nitratireducens]MBX0298202.1 hypothetical protein [Halomicroarcula nitratireducens]
MSQRNIPLQTSDSPPTVAVIEAVANQEGVDATELPPLSTVIDPDALDNLFTYSTDEFPHPEGRVVFPYCGYTITVHSDGQIVIEA